MSPPAAQDEGAMFGDDINATPLSKLGITPRVAPVASGRKEGISLDSLTYNPNIAADPQGPAPLQRPAYADQRYDNDNDDDNAYYEHQHQQQQHHQQQHQQQHRRHAPEKRVHWGPVQTHDMNVGPLHQQQQQQFGMQQQQQQQQAVPQVVPQEPQMSWVRRLERYGRLGAVFLVVFAALTYGPRLPIPFVSSSPMATSMLLASMASAIFGLLDRAVLTIA